MFLILSTRISLEPLYILIVVFYAYPFIYLDVPRHEGRVITLEYIPSDGEIKSTYMFVGKVRVM